MKVRLIKEIGTRAWLRTFVFPAVDMCHDSPIGRHEGLAHLADTATLRDFWFGGQPSDHPDFAFPTHCDHCGVDMSRMENERAIFHRRLYNTSSGQAGPGDMFYADWYHSKFLAKCLYGWKNCTSPHLVVVLPNGRQWDIDGRCSNCAAKRDRHHRCWVRHGSPPKITVSKQGLTCSIGNGSVVAGSWHGFLVNGELREVKKA